MLLAKLTLFSPKVSIDGFKYFIIIMMIVAPRSCGILETMLTKFLDSNPDVPSLIGDFDAIANEAVLEKYNLGLENEDKDLNITQLIMKYGYKVEEYNVTTEDGYILTMFRIPGDGAPVFLMHGIFSSADDFLTVGPDKALPYLLSNAGYDVWLGNARGSKHSRKHVRLSPVRDKAEFFYFSWHEIGYYDLPAMIDYVLDKTGESSLNYVAHSQGTTTFFVLCSERPEYNNKIKIMVALSAVVYMSHLVSPIVRLVVPLESIADIVTTSLGFNEFPADNPLVVLLKRGVCGNTVLANIFCATIPSAFGGFDYGQVNVTNAPVIYTHYPSGGSVRQLYHYGQEINSGKFRQYDHGVLKNIQIYGTMQPPEYKLENVNTSVAIFYSKYNDWFSAYVDVEKLVKELKNVVEFYEVPWKKFSHGDFLWAKDVDKLVYKKVLQLIDKYNK